MDETPGSETRPAPILAEPPAPALPAPAAPHRSARRAPVAQRWRQSALVGAVIALGLLQGSRAALGRMPDASAEGRPAAAAAPPQKREVDAVRGHFYRPSGSDAVRPPLHLDERRWNPPAPQVATSCTEPPC
jgi:hypothetical protein